MWSTALYSNPITNKQDLIRFLTDTQDNRHWVVFRDLVLSLGYSTSSAYNGLCSIADSIPESGKRVEFTSYFNKGTDKKLAPVIMLNSTGCAWFLSHTTKRHPSLLRTWLEQNVFSTEEIAKADEDLKIINSVPAVDMRHKENHLAESINCYFDETLIRVATIADVPYFYVTDIADVFKSGNLRNLVIAYVNPDHKALLYKGQRGSTVLCIEGVIELLNHIQQKELVERFKNWLIDTVIPCVQAGEKVPDYWLPPELSRLYSHKEDGGENEESTVKTAPAEQVDISFINPSTLPIKTYPYRDKGSLKVLLIGDTAYFLTKSLAQILEISVETINDTVPAVWKSFQTIKEQVEHTSEDGQTRTSTVKSMVACLLDSGVYTLLNQLDDPDVSSWFINIVRPNLLCAGYVPSNPYDLDIDGIPNETELKANDVSDPVAFVTTKGEGEFSCRYGDVDIAIIHNETGTWFALASVEDALDFPTYILKSSPLKGVNFNVVGLDQVQKMGLSGSVGWQPYFIEYEGLKSFLAECDKPNAESFYLNLEDVIMPTILKEVEATKKEDEKIMEEKSNKTVDPVASEEATEKPVQESGEQQILQESIEDKPEPPVSEQPINIDKLLSDPDSFIRILKGYKTVKESRADLTAENEALREYIRANKSKVDFAEALAHNLDSDETNKFIRKLAESIVESGSQKLKEWLREILSTHKEDQQ